MDTILTNIVHSYIFGWNPILSKINGKTSFSAAKISFCNYNYSLFPVSSVTFSLHDAGVLLPSGS